MDVRDKSEHDKERLPGARHILITDMNDAVLENLDKNLEIVTYSEDYECLASKIAAEKLESAGFKTFKLSREF